MKQILWLATLGLFSAQVWAADAAPVGDAQAGQAKSAACAACHGPGGNSQSALYPKLAGQSPVYIVKQLNKFKSGERNNPVMMPQATNLSEQDMQDIGAYYAAQKPGFGAANEQAAPIGQKLYLGGNPATGVPACSGCHGPAGAGNAAAGYPQIGGQHTDYVANALRSYKDGTRKAPAMSYVAAKLTEEEIQALASFLAGLH
ncbi:MAG: c-type cytochrome [Nevskiales bacterium]